MEGEQKQEYFSIPKTKKHFNTMVHKMNTEKLRVMLREKCRIRVREARHNKHDVSRAFLDNEKQWLTNMLKDELTELELDLLLEDKILDEIIDEQYDWMIQQYERSIDIDPLAVNVMCPICQISELTLTNNLINCECGFQLNFNGTLEEFRNKVMIKVAKHEVKCNSKSLFFMDPNESTLNIMCNYCDFFGMIE